MTRPARHRPPDPADLELARAIVELERPRHLEVRRLVAPLLAQAMRRRSVRSLVLRLRAEAWLDRNCLPGEPWAEVVPLLGRHLRRSQRQVWRLLGQQRLTPLANRVSGGVGVSAQGGEPMTSHDVHGLDHLGVGLAPGALAGHSGAPPAPSAEAEREALAKRLAELARRIEAAEIAASAKGATR